MNDNEVGQYWNNNAEAWTILVRTGFDVYRDYLNTPAFFAILPPIDRLHGLDIGCGEGHNTRLLARKGASVQGIDIADVFIRYAIEEERAQPLGVQYQIASAMSLPFHDAQFDFATAFMCLMDMAEPERAIQEALRVLKPGGFFQCSIAHPCFDTPHRKNLRDAHGQTYAIEVGKYFTNQQGEIEEWIFKAAPADVKRNLPRFKIPRFTRTLTQWISAFLDAGFCLEQINEPRPDDDTVRQQPELQDSQVVAYFLHIRCRKPL
jgi:ubiquinone/menaquinone biosynthesis C-methylase UbiE